MDPELQEGAFIVDCSESTTAPLRISITLDQQIPLRYNVTPGFKLTSFIMGNTPL